MGAKLAEILSILALIGAGMVWLRQRALTARIAALEGRLAPPASQTRDATAQDPAQAGPAATPQVLSSDEPGGAVPPAGAMPQDPASASPADPAAAPSGWNPQPGNGAGLAWLRENWIYPVAAGALILAGVFLVQYSIERGLLTPALRVALAVLLGAGLIAAGEGVRRRGDSARSLHLPATFAGAGVVVLYAAVLAALHLYGMIGPVPAFVLMTAITALAMGLGWVHGALLAALGVLGGTAAPFLLGGSGPSDVLYAYFGALAALGLGIDAYRRWRWVSWLALAAPTGAVVLLWLGGAGDTGLALVLVINSALAMTLPGGALVPRAAGAMASARLFDRAAPRPDAATALSAAMTLTAAGLLAVLLPGWAGALGLTALVGLHAIWARSAPALADQTAAPALGLVVWSWLAILHGGPGWAFLLPVLPGAATPTEASLMAALAVMAGAALLWRAEAEGARNRTAAGVWTLGALALPGAVMVVLDLRWTPWAVIGAYAWALHAMALAAAATTLALRYARLDGGQELRLGASASAAFALIALGLFALLGPSALTLALAVLMVAAAAMMRRFGLPELGVFVVAASLALSWRLVVDPGIWWIINNFDFNSATTPEVLLTLLAVLGGPGAALWLMPRGTGRWQWTRLFVETALSGHVAIAAAVVLARLLPVEPGAHAILGLNATVLIALAMVQHQRSALPFGQRWRRGLIWIYSILAGILLAVAVGPVSPLTGGFLGGTVRGPVLFNDLLLAYVLPGLMLVVRTGPRLRWVGALLIAYGMALVLRHMWQGAGGMPWTRGIAEGELYAYTVALLLAGAGFVLWALRSGQAAPRRIGMALVGLAAVKAFGVDVSGLGGLMRVFAFLGLGLALAGLAWLNRWAAQREIR